MSKNEQLSSHLCELAALRRQKNIVLGIIVEELIKRPQDANELRDYAIEQLAYFEEMFVGVKKAYQAKRKSEKVNKHECAYGK